MRRTFAAIGLLALTVAFSAACTSASRSSTATSTERGGGARGEAAVPAAGAGSERDVCAAIRAAIMADMTPFGRALGSVVGSAAGNDAKRRAAAVRSVDAALRKISADISAAGASATSDEIRDAATTAVAQIDALAADPSVMAAVDSVDDIPAVTAKLVLATAPIASACQGS